MRKQVVSQQKHGGHRGLPAGAAIACLLAALGAMGCEEGAGIGARCAQTNECRADLQCLNAQCVPRCTAHFECGDGFVCGPAGECERVTSVEGSVCQTELDCGPGQTCQLSTADDDGDGWLESTCVAENIGTSIGNACSSDGDCRSGMCMLGSCTQLCRTNHECPAPFQCTVMPGLTQAGEETGLFFEGCLEPQPQLQLTLHADEDNVVHIPMPSMALSFTVIMRSDARTPATEAETIIGMSELRGPPCRAGDDPECKEQLYTESGDGLANPIRYTPARAISTLLVPNTPDPGVALRPGVYRLRLRDRTAREVTVIYKTTATTKTTTGQDAETGAPTQVVTVEKSKLDLDFYFLDLSNHPCLPGFDQGYGKRPDGFDSIYLAELSSILGQADIEIGEKRYITLLDEQDASLRSDLDGLRAEDLPKLLRLSNTEGGIDIFFVRTISPAGIQVLSGGNPGPPGLPNTPASGIAVAADTLCYRDWKSLARATAHGIGLYMGLFRNREPDGAEDPIADSDTSSNNLMFFGDLGGTQLSSGQKKVLHLYPGLR